MPETLVMNGPSTMNIGLENEVYQHGTIAEFITSNLEGVQSGFIRCIYRAKNKPNQTVTLLCEKVGGCCVDGCCPKDQFWMTGLIVLLIFILVIFIVGTLSIIICYQRSKNKQRRQEKEYFDYGPEPPMYARSHPDFNNGLGGNPSMYATNTLNSHHKSRF